MEPGRDLYQMLANEPLLFCSTTFWQFKWGPNKRCLTSIQAHILQGWPHSKLLKKRQKTKTKTTHTHTHKHSKVQCAKPLVKGPGGRVVLAPLKLWHLKADNIMSKNPKIITFLYLFLCFFHSPFFSFSFLLFLREHMPLSSVLGSGGFKSQQGQQLLTGPPLKYHLQGPHQIN